MIAGTGIDILRISRLKNALERFPDTFAARVFTRAELEYAAKRGKAGLTTLAGRWAAKEAVSKALGCGIGKNCAFTELEILPDADHRPVLTLRGAAKEFLQARGGGKIVLSLSHETDYAIAMAIWEQPS